MTARLKIEEELPLRALIGWPDNTPPYETSLIERCEAALDLPLHAQTVETLRLLLGQGIGANVLLPRVLKILEENILACGGLYEGDLLQACLRLPASFWIEHPEYWIELDGILKDFDENVEKINKNRSEFSTNNPFGAQP